MNTKLVRLLLIASTLLIFLICSASILAQNKKPNQRPEHKPGTNVTFYDVPPRNLIDAPTAGILPHGAFNIGLRLYPNGGALGYVDIGFYNRFILGFSYGAENAVSSSEPDWNPNVQFDFKIRLVDELEYFPAIAVGFNSQGIGHYDSQYKRYAFKSKGFYAVASRSIYFYKWTSGWHGGINYSTENKVDKDKDVDFFVGFDATFDYNLAYMIEYDLGLNDDRSSRPTGIDYNFSGKGRGYLNMSFKWLFTDNLELELIFKDLLVNRRESKTISREIRFQYNDHF